MDYYQQLTLTPVSPIRIESGQGFERVRDIDYYVSWITQPKYKAMFVVNVHLAKTQLSRLFARFVGCKPHSKRQADIMKGKVVIPDSFFDPLPEEELAAWEGR